MSSLNKVLIIGRLGKDPELKDTENTHRCNLSVATSELDKDKKERTEWHRITVFGKTAGNCVKYLKKGSLAYFEGKLQTRTWEKDGKKHYSTEIVAHTVQFLGTKGDHAGTEIPKQEEFDDIDNIPF